MAEAKTWKNMGNLSGKPGILLTKMRLSSKKVMEIGQKMVWKTWKTWNFDHENVKVAKNFIFERFSYTS